MVKCRCNGASGDGSVVVEWRSKLENGNDYDN